MLWFGRGKGRYLSSVLPYHGALLIELKATSFGGGFSFGPFCFAHTRYPEREIFHAYGHYRQSLYLGPLYLIIVGIPSFVMAVLTCMGVLSRDTFFMRWPENWADKLGNVIRPCPVKH
jgi:hypothetical protein